MDDQGSEQTEDGLPGVTSPFSQNSTSQTGQATGQPAGQNQAAQAPRKSATLTVKLASGETIVSKKIPFISLDLAGNFHLLTGADIIELIRQIFNGVFDSVIKPIRTIVKVISTLAVSLNSFSYNIIEAGLMPFVPPIKLALIAATAAIPAASKLKVIDTDSLNTIKNAVVPSLTAAEPVLKEVAWLGSLALCAVSPLTVTAARALHPIMNQDDLPPWERLTHKNPLFAIFLDEIAWRGSVYSTGSLIFQTKGPAVLPYLPLGLGPIVHISPHLL